MKKQDGCVCQGCGDTYQVDLIVPDEVWEKIKPEKAEKGGGLLCGACIMSHIETMSDYAAWELVKV
jgi:hypothetical protein